MVSEAPGEVDRVLTDCLSTYQQLGDDAEEYSNSQLISNISIADQSTPHIVSCTAAACTWNINNKQNDIK